MGVLGIPIGNTVKDWEDWHNDKAEDQRKTLKDAMLKAQINNNKKKDSWVHKNGKQFWKREPDQ
jgi:hypothetical protein